MRAITAYASATGLLTRITGTVLFLLGLSMLILPVQAAGLGKMRVMSELGAPFRAEIEMLSLKPEEEGELTVKLASPDLFRQAGIDYNPALSSIRANYSKNNPNVISLSSAGPLNEPLLELLVEASWQSGRLVRQYTVLLDPPSGVADKPQSAEMSLATLPAAQVPAVFVPPPTIISNPTPTSVNSVPLARSQTQAEQGTYDVRSGDTLYSIAKRLSDGDEGKIKQLMAQLLQNNPHAFLGNNINKLKSGVVLNTGAAVGDANIGNAPRLIAKPTVKSFTQYKQAAAQNVKPLASKTASKKSVTSQVSAAKKADSPVQTTDQLKVSGDATLTKNAANPSNTNTANGANKTNPAANAAASNTKAEEKLAKDKQLAEEKSRLAELQNNIKKTLDIKNSALAQSTAASTTPSNASTAAGAIGAAASSTALAVGSAAANKPAEPGKAPTAPTAATVTPPPALSSSTAPAVSASNPSVNLPAPALPAPAAAAPKTVKPATPAVPETEWYEDIDPLTLGGGAGVLALLGAWVVYRRKRSETDNSFADTEFSPRDTQGSLLTVDGGQAVDTFNSVFASNFSDTGSAMEAAEVDPVAEADVYMQYGRDAHAEDILKDALKTNPNRHPVRIKLMELYAKQQNTEALTQQYTAMSELTQNAGADWMLAKKIVESAVGQSDDLQGASEIGRGRSTGLNNGKTPADILMGSGSGSQNTSPRFNLSEPTMIGEVITPKTNTDRSAGGLRSATGGSMLDSGFEMPITLETGLSPATQIGNRVAAGGKAPVPNKGLNFDISAPSQIFAPNQGARLDSLDIDTFAPLSVPNGSAGKVKPLKQDNSSPDSLLEFKLSKMDAPGESVFGDNTNNNFAATNAFQSMETKLSLAQAYLDIGDKIGAKELLQEVMDSDHQTLAQQASALMAKV